MIKLFFLFFIFLNYSSLSYCFAPEYLDQIATSGQEQHYVEKQLVKLLSPLEYRVDYESINISRYISTVLSHKVRIYNDKYALRSILFQVIKDEIKYYGHVYLAVVDIESIKNEKLNNSFELFYSSGEFRLNSEKFGLMLVKSLDESQYCFDLSPFDLFR